MEAHVISLNDDIRLVVIDDEEKAEKELERLAYGHWDDNNWDGMNYEQYRNYIHWTIKSVKAL